MITNIFEEEKINEQSPKWKLCIDRYDRLYSREEDIRSEFYRDYSRILHCQSYRRLKHKTQVFFATHNDHICTRIEHVSHVVSVSYTIANFLGLNTELTSAIALGHDIGHAPFGHEGETRLRHISEELGLSFWHEGNGVYVCDNIATLADADGNQQNLNLTYAVRDGIISHCGEINENAIKPREKHIDLSEILKPNQFNPFTWEACVVKISDKISYLGRDIEDAIELGLLSTSQLFELKNIVYREVGLKTLNNGILMHDLIIDLCKNSNPKDGLLLSDKHLKLINSIKKYNENNIYNNEKIRFYKEYSGLIINTIYQYLSKFYNGSDTIKNLNIEYKMAPNLISSFEDWVTRYSDIDPKRKAKLRAKNRIIYNLAFEIDYKRAIIDFIAGMTDNFAIKMYNEIISF